MSRPKKQTYIVKLKLVKDEFVISNSYPNEAIEAVKSVIKDMDMISFTVEAKEDDAT